MVRLATKMNYSLFHSISVVVCRSSESLNAFLLKKKIYSLLIRCSYQYVVCMDNLVLIQKTDFGWKLKFWNMGSLRWRRSVIFWVNTAVMLLPACCRSFSILFVKTSIKGVIECCQTSYIHNCYEEAVVHYRYMRRTCSENIFEVWKNRLKYARHEFLVEKYQNTVTDVHLSVESFRMA